MVFRTVRTTRLVTGRAGPCRCTTCAASDGTIPSPSIEPLAQGIRAKDKAATDRHQHTQGLSEKLAPRPVPKGKK